MNILNGFLVNEEVLGMLFSMLMGILVGGIIAIGYFIANNGKKFSKNFVITILILPVIMAITIPFIATDLKKTLSLAGIFALVRFRSMPGDSKDILYLFLAACAGLIVGLQSYLMAFVLVIVVSIIFILMIMYTFFICLIFALFNYPQIQMERLHPPHLHLRLPTEKAFPLTHTGYL